MRTIRNDTGGAVMVLAVFMAMIVIGFLYYLVGLGDAMLAQERMQDAADATAFSSAVIHARGMNIMALLNIIMASVLAILVLLSMIASLLKVAAAALIVAGFFFPPLLSGVTPLRTQATAVTRIEKKLAPKVEKLIVAMHKLQKPLNRVIPLLANVNAVKLARSSYAPIVDVAVTFPIMSGLPTVEGKFETLCEKAGEYAGSMATFPIRAVVSFLGGAAGDYVADFLGDKAKSIGKKYALYYCGVGEKPDAPSFSIERGVPELNSTARVTCQDKNKDISEAQRDKACENYEAELKSIAEGFDFEDGKCTADGKDKLNCEQMIRRARNECNPNQHKSRIKYKWRQATVTRTFELRGSGENSRIHELPAETLGKEMKAKRVGFASGIVMCKIGHESAFVENEFGQWNNNPLEPVCTTPNEVPTVAEMKLKRVTRVVRTHKEITHILHCAQNETIEAPLEDGGFTDTMKEQKPQDMCNCATLGDEMFQVRSVVFGSTTPYTEDSDKRILIATGGKASPDSLLGEMASWSGRFSAAQAEYYFDSNKPRSEWLWHMHWKARMRRLQVRPAYECQAKPNTCTGQSKSVIDHADFDKITKLLGDSASTIISH